MLPSSIRADKYRNSRFALHGGGAAVDPSTNPAARSSRRTRFVQLTIAWGVAVAIAWGVATYVGQRPTFGGDGRAAVRRTPVEVLASWDGTIYASIASNGYQVTGNDRRLFVFFPLFPGVSRALGGAGHAALAGIIVSQLSLLAAMLLLSYFGRGVTGERLLSDPALWMLCAPMALFFHAMYSESLFVLLTIGAAVAFRQSRFAITVALAFLAGLTRPTAVTFCIPFAWAAVSAWRRGDRWLPPLICAAAPIAGVAAYLVTVGVALGDPMAYTSLRATKWHYELAIPFVRTASDAFAVAYDWRHGNAADAWQVARLWTVGSAVLLLLWGWRRIESMWVAYVVASLAFIHASNPPGSTARYEVVLFPLFILFAMSPVANRRIAPAFLTGSFATQVFLLVLFGRWVWVG